jgi:hypothetical protein
VLFVGVIQKRRNVGRLVKAFERLPAGWPGTTGASEVWRGRRTARGGEAGGARHHLGHLSGEQLADFMLAPASSLFPRSTKASECRSQAMAPESRW